MLELGRFYRNFIHNNCPDLDNWQVYAREQWIEKHLTISTGTSLHIVMPETTLCIKLTAGRHTLEESFGTALPADIINKDGICTAILSLYEHLRRKTGAIPTLKSYATCVFAPKMASKILSLTLGHHAKASVMQDCFPHAVFLHIPSLSPKLTVIDYANSAFGNICPFPVYMDDEGVAASNVSLVHQGQMDLCMTNRETAGTMDMPLTGNARTASYKSAPQIHTRNLALMPWDDSVADMVASIEDGYYLVDGNNARWGHDDSFMLNATIGYRIKSGKIYESIMNTEAGGNTIKFLKSISMVDNDFYWFFNGVLNDDVKSADGAPTIKACLNI